MDRSFVEPSADMRQAASQLRQLFVALVNQGFDDRQALALVGQAVAAAVANQGGQS